jgi:hypothetical protein
MHEESTTLPELEGQAIDLDVGDGGDWVAIRKAGNRTQVGSVAGFFPLPDDLRYPLVRWIDHDRLVVVGMRSRRGDANARVFTRAGEELHRFQAGDAIQDVLIAGERIVVTYFDEADWGGPPPSSEGVAIFSTTGVFEGGYRSGAKSPVPVYDCYCACLGGPHELWFFPYTEFPLVRLDLRTLEQDASIVPHVLRGSHAIATDGRAFWFVGPCDEPTSVYQWRRGRHTLRPSRGGGLFPGNFTRSRNG